MVVAVHLAKNVLAPLLHPQRRLFTCAATVCHSAAIPSTPFSCLHPAPTLRPCSNCSLRRPRSPPPEDPERAGWFRPQSATHAGRGEGYWQRFNLKPGSDFEGFLQRQRRFVEVGRECGIGSCKRLIAVIFGGAWIGHARGQMLLLLVVRWRALRRAVCDGTAWHGCKGLPEGSGLAAWRVGCYCTPGLLRHPTALHLPLHLLQRYQEGVERRRSPTPPRQAMSPGSARILAQRAQQQEGALQLNGQQQGRAGEAAGGRGGASAGACIARALKSALGLDEHPQAGEEGKVADLRSLSPGRSASTKRSASPKRCASPARAASPGRGKLGVASGGSDNTLTFHPQVGAALLPHPFTLVSCCMHALRAAVRGAGHPAVSHPALTQPALLAAVRAL